MPNLRSTIKPFMINAVRLATLAWFIIHFGLTIVYVAPVNPIKMKMQRLVTATIGTFFSQNWSLFAPKPLALSETLLAKYLTKEALENSRYREFSAGGWIDVTTPLIERFQSNRFSAYDRLARPQMAGMREYFQGAADLAPWYEACNFDDIDSCNFVRKRMEMSRRHASILLARVASSLVGSAPPTHSPYVAVALRVRIVAPPPWSKRYSGAIATSDIDLGTLDLDNTVQPLTLFRGSK